MTPESSPSSVLAICVPVLTTGLSVCLLFFPPPPPLVTLPPFSSCRSRSPSSSSSPSGALVTSSTAPNASARSVSSRVRRTEPTVGATVAAETAAEVRRRRSWDCFTNRKLPISTYEEGDVRDEEGWMWPPGSGTSKRRRPGTRRCVAGSQRVNCRA